MSAISNHSSSLIQTGNSRPAIRGRIEEGKRKLFSDDTDIEIDEARAGNIDSDFFDRKPEKQLLSRHAGEGSDLAVADSAVDGGVVLDFGFELSGAGRGEEEVELTGGVDGEGGDGGREETDREAVGP